MQDNLLIFYGNYINMYICKIISAIYLVLNKEGDVFLKKNLFVILGMTFLMVGMIGLTGCSSSDDATATSGETAEVTEEKEYQYITKEDLKNDIEGSSEYIILDVRKAEDYDASHIINSVSADVDSIVSNEDSGPSTANLESALADLGIEAGNSDEKLVMVCYSGNRYAKSATDILEELGMPAANLYTLEGGMKGWAEGGDDYAALTE